MRDPIKLKLEYLASTYGIKDLGLAWIQQDAAGNRTLVLCEVPESVVVIDHPGATAGSVVPIDPDEGDWRGLFT